MLNNGFPFGVCLYDFFNLNLAQINNIASNAKSKVNAINIGILKKMDTITTKSATKPNPASSIHAVLVILSMT